MDEETAEMTTEVLVQKFFSCINEEALVCNCNTNRQDVSRELTADGNTMESASLLCAPFGISWASNRTEESPSPFPSPDVSSSPACDKRRVQIQRYGTNQHSELKRRYSLVIDATYLGLMQSICV